MQRERLGAYRENYAHATTCGGYSAGNQKEEEPPAHYSVGATSIGHSSMVKSSMGINIFAVLPLASNAGCAVSAAMIVPAIMARTASKYFRIDTHKDRDRQTGFGRSLVRGTAFWGVMIRSCPLYRACSSEAIRSVRKRTFSVAYPRCYYKQEEPIWVTAQNGLPLSV